MNCEETQFRIARLGEVVTRVRPLIVSAALLAASASVAHTPTTSSAAAALRHAPPAVKAVLSAPTPAKAPAAKSPDDLLLDRK